MGTTAFGDGAPDQPDTTTTRTPAGALAFGTTAAEEHVITLSPWMSANDVVQDVKARFRYILSVVIQGLYFLLEEAAPPTSPIRTIYLL
ncbi:uncharacterized protein LOC119465288 isoform X2 [Dermacentor silvarum]|uniref:uncharacterized protein LOC119465288 isoform X2 n=1 Tax=Dermacentor silvarum TaxID=543639 RepID=UPI00189B6854|nr:uncharacterized protein LOC119465288 isoform X2 [Dermacentor silvarum]